MPCPFNPILTSHVPGGRLGNKIFHYASMWGFSVLTNRTAFVSEKLKNYLLSNFFESLSLRTLEEIKHCNFSNNVTLTQRIIRPIPIRKFISSGQIQNHTTLISGYLFQPYLLLLINDELMTDEFVLKAELRREVEKSIDEAGGRGRVTVGVHVRRTDYVCYWKGILAEASFYKVWQFSFHSIHLISS
jgi:Glycosyl transferase family 11